MMKKIFLAALFAAVSLFAMDNACKSDVNGSKFVTNEVKISGLVLAPQKLTLANLKEMNATVIDSVAMVCGSGEMKEAQKSYKGVKLTELLDKAKIKIDAKHDQNKIYIVAKASDGYEVVFSYQELYNTPIGAKVIVFYEKDAKELSDNEGKIALVSADDIKTGPRHIKWLKSVEVYKIK